MGERSRMPLREAVHAICSKQGAEGFQKAASFALAFPLNEAVSLPS